MGAFVCFRLKKTFLENKTSVPMRMFLCKCLFFYWSVSPAKSPCRRERPSFWGWAHWRKTLSSDQLKKFDSVLRQSNRSFFETKGWGPFFPTWPDRIMRDRDKRTFLILNNAIFYHRITFAMISSKENCQLLTIIRCETRARESPLSIFCTCFSKFLDKALEAFEETSSGFFFFYRARSSHAGFFKRNVIDSNQSWLSTVKTFSRW